MPFPLYLAMTAAELATCTPPPSLGYMACHFSPYGAGLSNLPASLPPGSVLILNDRIRPHGHDPALVSSQLAQTAESVGAAAILLDLQQPQDPQTAQIVSAIVGRQPCPVAVSESYAGDVDCDVFLSAPALHTSLEKALECWQERRIWLELATEPELLILTRQGCRPGLCDHTDIPETGFFDEKLCCHYRMQPREDTARFFLWRTKVDLQLYLEKAQQLGVLAAVGLYQQLCSAQL